MQTIEILADRLSYEIRRTNEGNLDIILKIDGKPFNEYFNISNVGFCLSPQELIISLHNPGRFFIFTCDCGDPGCAGWFKGVLVEETGDSYTWEIDEKIPIPTKLVFSKKKYIEFIDNLSNELKQMAKSNPKA
jgi:hypothetical protein